MSTETATVVRSLDAIRQLPLNTAAIKGDGLGDPEVTALSSFRSLNELDLSGCDDVTDRSISCLSHISSLEELDLSFCNQITDASLAALARLPALRSLILNFCYAVGDSGLVSLSGCKSLELVSLMGCEEITDIGVKALASLPSLRVLDLPEFTAVSDDSLFSLSTNAPKLESLRLDHLNEISDQGIRHLAGLSLLRVLTVDSCSRVTTEAVAFLTQSLPECRINFKR